MKTRQLPPLPLALLLMLMPLGACEGPPGADGADGSPGPQGDPGEDGDPGMDGANGEPGEDGEDGTQGPQGEPGEDGEDGTQGPQGEPGQDGEDGQDYAAEPEALSIEFTGVTMDGGHPVAAFTATDQDDEPFGGIGQDLVASRAIRMTVVKLVPGVDHGADHWQSYVNTNASTANSTAGPDGVPAMASAIQATTESSGTLEYLGSGNYTYTFGTDITAVTSPLAVSYEEGLLHRVAMQLEFPLSSGEEIILNPTFDWVPSGADITLTRDIADTASCNECHGELALHGGGRQEVGYCVTCHNAGTTDPNSGNSLDLGAMVHAIHMGHDRAGDPYTIWGFRDSKNDYSHVTYPQSQANCAKCHSAADATTPNGDNWNTKPTAAACGACHADVVFATGENHGPGDLGPKDDSTCYVCHLPKDIKEVHTTEIVSENNPDLPTGVRDIAYDIRSVTVDEDGKPTVELSITSDGQALDLTSLPSDLTTPNRYPGFLLAYALPQDGIDAPADYNNLGNDSAQPPSVALNTILNGTAGSVSGSGPYYSLHFDQAFPEGATMRAVALQGYFQQDVGADRYSLHTRSVVVPVAGDDARREVVDEGKCLACHEVLDGHGGNRVNNPQVCVTCHNPNLSSSGRELNLDHPEASNNFRDLIHGIHAAEVRDTPLDFVRNRSGGLRYTYITPEMVDEYPEGTIVTFPGEPANCLTCHKDGTYTSFVREGALASTEMQAPDAESVDDVDAARATVPNVDDLVVSPQASACMGCHNSVAAQAHMEQNGGVVYWSRSEMNDEQPYETCEICHGAGRVADVDWAHGL